MGDRISRLDDYRDRLRDRVGPPEPDPPAPGSISERVRELTDGGTLRDPANRIKALHDPELRRRSRDLLRNIAGVGPEHTTPPTAIGKGRHDPTD